MQTHSRSRQSDRFGARQRGTNRFRQAAIDSYAEPRERFEG